MIRTSVDDSSHRPQPIAGPLIDRAISEGPIRSRPAVWPGPTISLGLSLLAAAVVAGCRLRARGAGGLLRGLLLGLTGLSWLYWLGIRPWHVRWGATEAEVRRSMLGDAEVTQPLLDATRAITIAAPPAAIWPWLLQMGVGRAGFYTYDWLERLGGMDIHNADHIVPQWQHLTVGDLVRTGPDAGFTVAALEPNRAMLLVIRDRRLHVSVSLQLEAIGNATTRLVTRLRVGSTLQGWWAPYYFLLFDPGDFILMQGMLRGIRARAERGWPAHPAP